MFITKATRRQARINNIIMLCLMTILLGLLAWLSNIYVVEYDWTHNGRHTLSEPSIELLQKMPDRIEVTAYARKNQLLRDQIKRFFTRYQRHKENMVLRFVNPDADPNKARELGISVDGEIIIHYQGRMDRVKDITEQSFTNALQRLARNEKKWIAFIEGHGERRAQGEANHDLSGWTLQLVNQGYQIKSLNLSDTSVIPADINMLVIAGPRTNYLAGELNIILDYINNGGNLLWLQDPGGLYKLDALAEALAIKFYDGVIIDHAGQFIGINEPTITLLNKSLYMPHPITEGFDLITLFPKTAALEILPSDEWTHKPILISGDHTWNDINTEKNEDIEFNQEDDTKGPLTIAIGMERELEKQAGEELITQQQRIVVLGDGDFLSNTYLANGGNSDLGTRIINWLSSDDEFIPISPKTAIDSQLNMSSVLLGAIGIGFLFILPLTLIIMGILIGAKRKKL